MEVLAGAGSSHGSDRLSNHVGSNGDRLLSRQVIGRLCYANRTISRKCTGPWGTSNWITAFGFFGDQIDRQRGIDYSDSKDTTT